MTFPAMPQIRDLSAVPPSPRPVEVGAPAAVDDRETIVGESDALRYVMHRLDQVAPTDAAVLLLWTTPAPARSCWRGRSIAAALATTGRWSW